MLTRKLLLLLSLFALGLGIAACDDDGDKKNATPDADTTTDLAEVLDDVDVLDDIDIHDVPVDQTAPTISNIILTENPANHLSASLEFETNELATAQISISSATGHAWTLAAGDTFATAFAVDLLGFRADSAYTVTISATDEAGNVGTDDTSTFTTAPLPSDFPPLEVITAQSAAMAPGFTLFDVFRWVPTQQGPDGTYGLYLMLDNEGEVVWYYHPSHRPEDIRRLPNGNLLYNHSEHSIVEIDMMGRVIHEWYADRMGGTVPDGAIAVDTDTFHHEVAPLPNGNFIALSTEAKTLTPTDCPAYDADYLVVGDVIVEFVPATGEVVNRWSLFDMIDPCRRIDHGFKSTFWEQAYGGDTVPTTADWTHSNAVVYDEANNVVMVSTRHQDWVIAFKYADDTNGSSGEVQWMLGDEGNAGDYNGNNSFTLSGTDADWSYHTHAPELTKDGNILLFDNGNLRPGTNFDDTDAAGNADLPYSRIVEYSLDTTNWTAEQTWVYKDFMETDANGADIFYYAPFVGDADELSNGNVLADFGGLVDPHSDAIGSPVEKKYARILELTKDAVPSVVFEVQIMDPAATDFVGYTVYRAERLETLEP
ncbi:MAG: hypothetical protein AUK47_13235 [Deltaproteobacteria bacterium CG2_30_63_29]|nr:MAG: hypothetical protein AUK47_13235 [Deltaproteobacteria bacterium CG2_30_63_29]PIV98915.1 MAG: hypothetical protein COW42_12765 [Deltaproteobacteria bacterium CG17_big_fil_post_rev_8_21_14_2_50_63_7]PJB37804.1 MAG: hypothetical protein CO108_20355 [Deltaproteobacteria bacterium CG_4_9_14_3_um_filter_63_12]